jgi:hypothetical protein
MNGKPNDEITRIIAEFHAKMREARFENDYRLHDELRRELEDTVLCVLSHEGENEAEEDAA